MPMKAYCEHGALTPTIRAMQRTGLVELVHFPYDPDSRSKHLSNVAMPSAARINDLNNLTIAELPGTWNDYSGSEHYEQILATIGPSNRRDALHVDSAFKSGCAAFITSDSDILKHGENLKALLGIRFFHPEHDLDALREWLTG